MDVGHLPCRRNSVLTMYRPAVGKVDVDGELARAAGGLGVHVGEGAEVVAGGDQVHPDLVGAGQVADRPAGRGVGERRPRRGWARRGGRRRAASRRTSTPASAASAGGISAVIITLIAGRIGMPVPCGPGQRAVHAALGGVGAAGRGQPGAEREGDDGDADEVGVLADPGAQRRVQDLVGRRRAGGSGAAAARW